MSDHTDLWVCEDCYFAHHYGVTVTATTEVAGGGTIEVPIGPDESVAAYAAKSCTIHYYAGDTDTPADREPLSWLYGDDVRRLTDNTCSDHDPTTPVIGGIQGDDIDLICEHCGLTGDENGIDTFSSRPCQGCGLKLGGSRYRLALHQEDS